MGDLDRAHRHASPHAHHESAASTDVADLGHMSASLSSKKHAHGHTPAPQPDLVRGIIDMQQDGNNTVITIVKKPEDIVIAASDPGTQPAYVQGMLGGEFWISSVTSERVIGVLADTQVEHVRGLFSAVLNASKVPAAGAPVALPGEAVLDKDTEIDIINYSVVHGNQFSLTLRHGAASGLQPGMTGQLKYKNGGFYPTGHFTIERTSATSATALVELHPNDTLSWVQNIILECNAVVFAAKVEAPKKAAKKKGHH